MDGGGTWSAAEAGLPDLGVIAYGIHPSNSQIVYVGTLGAGVYKSTDGGETWAPANTGLKASWVGTVVIDPSNPQIAYAGTYFRGVHKSTDGGGTWAQANTGLTSMSVSELAVSPSNPQIVYVGAGSALWASTDGGGTWARTHTGLPRRVACLAIDPSDPRMIHVGADTRVFTSTDGGGTWAEGNTGLSMPGFNSLAVDPFSPQIVYAATGKGVLRSTDGGGTWERVNRVSAYCLVIDPSNPQIVYVGNYYEGVLRSADGGENFVSKGLRGEHVFDLAIAPTDPQAVYAGTERGGVFRSTDGGGTWQQVNAGLTSMCVRSLGIAPSNPQIVFASTTRSGVYSRTFGPQNVAPVLRAPGGQTVTVGDALTVMLSASDADGDTLSFSMSGHPAGASLVDGLFTWSPSATDAGVHVLALSVHDDHGGSDSQTLNITVAARAAVPDTTIADSTRAAISVDLNPAPGDQRLEVLARVHPGQVVEIQLHVRDAPEIDGWSATLEYGPAQLRYGADSFVPSRFIPGLVSLAEEGNGHVEIGGAALGSGAHNSGDGELGTLSFTLLSPFSGRTVLRVSACRLRQVGGEWVVPPGGQALTLMAEETGEQPSPEVSFDFDPREGDQRRQALSGPETLFPMQLHIRHAPEMSGWSATLVYDPAKLRYVSDSFRAGDFVPGLVSLVHDEQGVLSIGGAILGTQEYGSGSGLLGQLSFEAVEEAYGRATLSIGTMTFRLANGETRQFSSGSSATMVRVDHVPGLTLDLNPVPGNQGRRGLERVAVGDLIPVELHIHDAPVIGGWSATLEYDAAQLRYVTDSFRPGDFVADLVSLVDDTPGVLGIGGAALGTGQTGSGDGQLGMVAFEVLVGFSRQAQVTATQLLLSAGGGDRLRYDVRVLASLSGVLVPTVALDFDLAEGDQGRWAIGGVHAGDTHRLQLNIRHAPSMDGWSATVRYDQEQLDYVDGSFRPSGFIPSMEGLVDLQNGVVTVGGAALGSEAQNSGAGTLGSLSFLVRDEFRGHAWVEVTEIRLHRPDGVLSEHPGSWQALLAGGGVTAVVEAMERPAVSRLLPSFPNPFNACTVVPFQVADAGSVSLDIFDVQGQRVCTLFSGVLTPGHHSYIWEGLDERRGRVAAGVYLVRLRIGDWHEVRSIALVK